ncbi:MAG: nucleotidyltransferase family protein [Deltaproteobacteria bacterium]|nr:nucleotidyltransferase family protein [Deltaproteobacteria bacterium]
MVSAILLAAGKAERMGEPKLFLPLSGKPILQWVLESVLKTNVSEIICVVRDLAADYANISVADDRLVWLVNDRADTGQSSSVITGLWGVDGRSEGALFVVGDQPLLSSALLEALINRFETVSAPIVAPSFQGQIRNPVLFRRCLFPELLELEGDRGGRAVIEKHKEQIELVNWNDEISFLDIDDQVDYERVKSLA